MSQHTTIRPASTRRGAVSRFNDNTMEYVIAATRVGVLVGYLAAVASLVAVIWSLDYRWALTVVVALAVATWCTWFGFIRNGNEEWFRDTTKH